MKVTLIDYTGKGHDIKSGGPAHYAASLLVFTKGTRLQMTADGLDDFLSKTQEELTKELEYMANTIPSSWEFVDYTFMVEGVTRAFTHQFVRSRHWSFAQQTMRVLDVSQGPGWDYLRGPTVSGFGKDKTDGPCDLRKAIYDETMQDISVAYKALIKEGAAVEDARGVLPTNILTNIVGKCNMRTFVETVRKRSSSRTQGEYREVLNGMKDAVRTVHPWIDLFISRDLDRAIADLEAEINAIQIDPISPGISGMPSAEKKTRMIKILDQLRAQL